MRALLLVLALAVPVKAGDGWETSLPKAMQAAKASGKKVFVDFTAPWCYSCYYMEKHVLEHPAFWEIARDMVVARIDVDLPEGKALQAAHRVRFLPSFLVLGPDGKEIGRILGEQREEDFLNQLKALVGRAKSTAEDEAVTKLDAYLRREDLGGAAAFAAKPGAASRKTLSARADWRRLELRLGLKRKPTAENLKAMIAANDTCDLAYDLMAGLKAKGAKEALAPLRPALETWSERRYWVPLAQRCADFRSGVDAMAGVYEALGDAAAKTALLERGATLISAESDREGLGKDRNLDDVRRYLLDAAGRDAELQDLFPRLVNAYPSDYVYAYRFAKWLAGKGRHAEALPWIEKAAKLCYGANRLSVTRVHAEILEKLGRRPEAEAMLRREIKGYRELLPKEVLPLEEFLASISSTRKLK